MNMHRNKPNLFVVGAAKAGTTALQKNLRSHPDIYFSPIKEPHFFSDDIDPANFRQDFAQDVAFDLEKYLENPVLPEHHQAFVRKESQYLSLYKNAENETILAEASASYLWSVNAAKNIFDFNPESKIIILLRNPVERAFSHYSMDARMGYTQVSFLEALEKDIQIQKRHWGNASLYVDLGLYNEQVARYLKVFPKDQIHIIWHDRMKTQPQTSNKELFNFLDVVQNEEINLSGQYNVAKTPRQKWVNSLINSAPIKKVRRQKWAGYFTPLMSDLLLKRDSSPKLTDHEKKTAGIFFKDDIAQLEILLSTDLTHWKE